MDDEDDVMIEKERMTVSTSSEKQSATYNGAPVFLQTFQCNSSLQLDKLNTSIKLVNIIII